MNSQQTLRSFFSEKFDLIVKERGPALIHLFHHFPSFYIVTFKILQYISVTWDIFIINSNVG